MNFPPPDGHGKMTVTRMSIVEDEVHLDFEGAIEGYGTVFVTQIWKATNADKSRGVMSGQARVFLSDGTLLSSPLRGALRRHNSTVTVHFVDAVSNGAQNFVTWDIDLLSKKVAVRYHELHPAN